LGKVHANAFIVDFKEVPVHDDGIGRMGIKEDLHS
jgi:hypothetical protein